MGIERPPVAAQLPGSNGLLLSPRWSLLRLFSDPLPAVPRSLTPASLDPLAFGLWASQRWPIEGPVGGPEAGGREKPGHSSRSLLPGAGAVPSLWLCSLLVSWVTPDWLTPHQAPRLGSPAGCHVVMDYLLRWENGSWVNGSSLGASLSVVRGKQLAHLRANISELNFTGDRAEQVSIP